MLGSSQPEVLAEFYRKVIGRPADMEEGGWYGWQIGKCFLTIGEHSDVKESSKEPQRIMLNFETREVQVEFERIKELGAKIIAEPYDMQGGLVATFADPDGNYLQLMTPWDSAL